MSWLLGSVSAILIVLIPVPTLPQTTGPFHVGIYDRHLKMNLPERGPQREWEVEAVMR